MNPCDEARQSHIPIHDFAVRKTLLHRVYSKLCHAKSSGYRYIIASRDDLSGDSRRTEKLRQMQTDAAVFHFILKKTLISLWSYCRNCDGDNGPEG